VGVGVRNQKGTRVPTGWRIPRDFERAGRAFNQKALGIDIHG
jgi:hypothetical protein